MRLETERLTLRRWRPEDRGPFAAMSADPAVMVWLGGVLDRDHAAAYMARSEAAFDSIGMGRFAIERKADGAFLGSAGLMPGRDHIPFAPYIDIGWRLAPAFQGQGYATEAARAVAEDGFARLGLSEIFAVTAVTNRASRAVMRRIGFIHHPGLDFENTGVPADDPNRASVAYAGRP